MWVRIILTVYIAYNTCSHTRNLVACEAPFVFYSQYYTPQFILAILLFNFSDIQAFCDVILKFNFMCCDIIKCDLNEVLF